MHDAPGATSDCRDLTDFIAEARQRGCTTAIIAWQREYAQDVAAAGVVYDRVRFATVLSYHRGTVIRVALRNGDADVAAIRAACEAAGLRVEERSRNLV
jgi:hypothetical protein